MKVSTVGLDLAKNVFQVHAVDEAGEVIVRKALRRGRVKTIIERLEPSLIGMEACGTSPSWGRELRALGHEVKLMPPAYVKAMSKPGSSAARPTRVMRRPSARRWGGRVCALLRSSRPISSRYWRCTGRVIC